MRVNLNGVSRRIATFRRMRSASVANCLRVSARLQHAPMRARRRSATPAERPWLPDGRHGRHRFRRPREGHRLRNAHFRPFAGFDGYFGLARRIAVAASGDDHIVARGNHGLVVLVVRMADGLAIALDVLPGFQDFDRFGAWRANREHPCVQGNVDILCFAYLDRERLLGLGKTECCNHDIVAGRQLELRVRAVFVLHALACTVQTFLRTDDLESDSRIVCLLAAFRVIGVHHDVTDAYDDILLHGFTRGKLYGFRYGTLADACLDPDLPGRKDDTGVAILCGLAAWIFELQHCPFGDFGAFRWAGMNNQRAGIENEERLRHLTGLDGDPLLGPGLAKPGANDIVAGFEIALVVAIFDADLLAGAAIGLRLVNLPAIAIGDGLAALGHDYRRLEVERGGLGLCLRFRLRSRVGFGDGYGQRFLQPLLVGGGDIFASRVSRQAGHLPALFVGQAEADYMGRKVDSAGLQFLAERAGVAAAGFQPIGDQDHPCLVLGIFQRLRRAANGVGQRRLAEELHA